jgi:hypothetical protein
MIVDEANSCYVATGEQSTQLQGEKKIAKQVNDQLTNK